MTVLWSGKSDTIFPWMEQVLECSYVAKQEYIHDGMREFVHDIMEWLMYNGKNSYLFLGTMDDDSTKRHYRLDL